MRIDHGRLDVLVAEQFLYFRDIDAGLKEVCCEAVTLKL
jgi:hypothetical protein